MKLLDKLLATRRRIGASLLNIQAISLARKGSYKKAQQLFEKAIELSPGYPHPRINLSNILLRDGRYSQAEFQLRRALESDPDSKTQQDAWNNLANICFYQKRYSEAINLYNRAISVYKPDYEIYYNMGISFEKLGEWEDALDYYERSDNHSPHSKAQQGLERVKQLMWRSSEMSQILNAYEGFETGCRKCGDDRLTPNELEKVEQVISSGASLVFFVGAGISYPCPSCIPIASRILRQVFHFLFELDRDDIYEMLQVNTEINEEKAYTLLSRGLLGIARDVPDDNSSLPFEATFQALYNVAGFPTIRFVDLLQGEKPNLHHKMLAYALHEGHTVVTTNFDQQIEEAYAAYFPGEPLPVLVTDKDFQDALDDNRTSGILAKIHGDMDDYNSLALTLEGVAAGCDGTIYLGDDIDTARGGRQLQWVHPRTALSIPKALFLQEILQDRETVVMGYSGSDAFDIMPILTASEFRCRGLWVAYASGSLAGGVEEWRRSGQDRAILQPGTEEEEKSDIPAKVSRYFLGFFGGSWREELDGGEHPAWISDSFRSWIDRLRLRPGDGLACIAWLYLQRGKYGQSKLFFERAIRRYEEDREHNEWRWLVARSNVGYVMGNLDQENQAFKIFTEVQQYIEDAGKQGLYPSTYANALLNLAGKWINTSLDDKAGAMVDEAIRIAEETGDKKILSHGLRLAADRYLGQKEYAKALDLYLLVIQLAGDVLGDTRELCLGCMHAGICLASMGRQYDADQLMVDAETYAKLLGDEELIRVVTHNQDFVAGRFLGVSPSLDSPAELLKGAKRHLDAFGVADLDQVIEYIRSQQYDRALHWLDELLQTHDHPAVQAFLLFSKSNIYQRRRQHEEEIEWLKKFCQISPPHPLAEHNLGVAYSRLKNYPMAEKHLLKAIELANENYPLATYNLGIMYARIGRLEAAKEQLLRAEQLGAPKDWLETLGRRIAELEATRSKQL